MKTHKKATVAGGSRRTNNLPPRRRTTTNTTITITYPALLDQAGDFYRRHAHEDRTTILEAAVFGVCQAALGTDLGGLGLKEGAEQLMEWELEQGLAALENERGTSPTMDPLPPKRTPSERDGSGVITAIALLLALADEPEGGWVTRRVALADVGLTPDDAALLASQRDANGLKVSRDLLSLFVSPEQLPDRYRVPIAYPYAVTKVCLVAAGFR